ncbi:MAG: DUF58 domain-containing protein [Candidatus Sumerlaeaceae bacterium]|nr:DUF58 domain-containing protein [Candidatus Sumerlaeaceae bacterium]
MSPQRPNRQQTQTTLGHAAIPWEILAQVRRLEIVTRRMVNEVVAGRYHSVFKGRGMEFVEVREYAPGDDIRAIDWNVTARTGSPHVKTFIEERELTVLLMVDLSGSMQFGSADRLKSEIAAELCALLAFSAIKNNDRIGLLVFTDQVELLIPPRKGGDHGLRIIREILAFQARGKGSNLEAATAKAIKLLKRKSVIFLISDFWVPNVRRSLQLLNRKHDLIALILRDPREREILPCGIAPLQDAEKETVIWVDTMDREFRRRYEESARQADAAVEALLRSLQVDHAVIECGKPYVDRIVKVFEQRALRY